MHNHSTQESYKGKAKKRKKKKITNSYLKFTFIQKITKFEVENEEAEVHSYNIFKKRTIAPLRGRNFPLLSWKITFAYFVCVDVEFEWPVFLFNCRVLDVCTLCWLVLLLYSTLPVYLGCGLYLFFFSFFFNRVTH